MSEKAVDLRGIASVLNVSIDTARRRAQSGAIPSFRVGSLWRFLPSVVIAHLAAPAPDDDWAMPANSKNARRAA